MKPRPASSGLTRRHFLGAGAGAAAWASLASGTARTAPAAGATRPNPWAYDLRGFERTDPKLIQYRELRRFQCGRSEARRLALGPDNRLWVAAGNYACAFNETGQPVAELAFAAPVRCVAVAAEGEVFVGLRDHLEVFDAEGRRQAVWESPHPKTWFTGLAVTPDAVFAADSGQRVVLHYDRSGNLRGRIGEKDPDRGIPGLVLPSPYLDVEWHPDGLLRLNNAGRHKVEAYTLAGELAVSWGKPTMGIEGFCGCCNPVALTLLPDGRFVTCEKGLPRVKVYSVHGEFEGVVAGVESFPQNARVGPGSAPGEGVKASLDAVADRAGRIFILDTITAEIRLMVRSEPA
jgi:hypothetical protein